MNKVIKKFKTHKVLSSAIISICVIGIVGGEVAFGIHQAKIANTHKALELAKDGYVDQNELSQLGEEIALDEEIVLEDGTVVVVSCDENGNYITHSDNPSSPYHSHTWVPHWSTHQISHEEIVHHPAVKESHTFCCVCHADVTDRAVYAAHTCKDGHFNTTQLPVIITPGWSETITVYSTEEYVDYYYCSECGTRL